MNTTMKVSLALAVAVFLAVLVWVAIISKPGETNNNANSNQTITEQEEDNVADTLENFDPVTAPVEELQIIDLVEGDGEEVSAGDTITAHYTGAYAVNGEVFESSKTNGQPFTSPLSGLIRGWQEGIPGMREGGTRRLIIPGSLAYGEAPEGYEPGSGGSPMGPLVFDIELISID